MRAASFAAIATAAMGISGCDQWDGDRAPYTLYRGSIVGDMRIHLATFDADEGRNYNQNNCQLAADLFQQQPGVTVRYWCEKGRFRP